MDRVLLPRVAGEGALDPSACPRGSRSSDATFSHPSPKSLNPGQSGDGWGPARAVLGAACRTVWAPGVVPGRGPLVLLEAPR